MKATTQKPTELLFPTAGINVATEFGRQPKMTTPEGENVRAYDVLERRERGGSRPGLIKYIGQQVPGGASVIQHLTVVVDPQAPFLLADNEIDGDEPYPEVLDTSTNNNAAGYGPRNPGRFVRGGGSGRPQDRHPRTTAPELDVISKDGVDDGVVFLAASIGGGDPTGINVRAYFPGAGPPSLTEWLVDSDTFSALNAAAIGSLTNSPPVKATLAVTPGDTGGGYVATFSVQPPDWTY